MFEEFKSLKFMVLQDFFNCISILLFLNNKDTSINYTKISSDKENSSYLSRIKKIRHKIFLFPLYVFNFVKFNLNKMHIINSIIHSLFQFKML